MNVGYADAVARQLAATARDTGLEVQALRERMEHALSHQGDALRTAALLEARPNGRVARHFPLEGTERYVVYSMTDDAGVAVEGLVERDHLSRYQLHPELPQPAQLEAFARQVATQHDDRVINALRVKLDQERDELPPHDEPARRGNAYFREVVAVEEALRLDRHIARPSVGTLAATTHLYRGGPKREAVRLLELERMRRGLTRSEFTAAIAQPLLPERLRGAAPEQSRSAPGRRPDPPEARGLDRF